MPTVVTWNTQGDPRHNGLKQTQLNIYLATFDYVLLQEAGGLTGMAVYNSGGVNYTIYGASQAGAFNNRCGTLIMTNRGFNNAGAQSLVNSNGRYGIWVRDILTNTYVATMHSNSAPNAPADRTAFFNFLYQRYGGAARIVIGADFNSPPPPSPLNTHTFHIPRNWIVRNTGLATHMGGNELDYFFTRNLALNPGTAVALGPVIPPRGTGSSDHAAVEIDVI